jgi:hypothetical protein
MVKQLMIDQDVQCLCRLVEMSWPLAHTLIMALLVQFQDMFECIPGMDPATSRGEVI